MGESTTLITTSSAPSTLNNAISSMKVTDGYTLRGYDGEDFTGAHLDFTGDDYDSDYFHANSFNDKLSSWKCIPGK